MPYSKYNPQFNKESLIEALKNRDISYAHFGKEFGARHTSPTLLDANYQVDFYKVRETDDFKNGIRRLEDAINLGYKITLMCSEANPLDCHRFSMVSYQLVREGFEVIHILPDSSTITNEELEHQMIEKYFEKIPQSTLFEFVTPEQQLEAAYKIVMKKVAYRPSSLTSDQLEEN
jgi:uncharacterized protein (DUF488 family)